MIRWLKTTREAYSHIYAAHRDAMRVHGTITNLGSDGYPRHVMTEWGLPGADFPIMKHEDRENEHSFYLAVITQDDQA